jgi:PKD repeat protein
MLHGPHSGSEDLPTPAGRPTSGSVGRARSDRLRRGFSWFLVGLLALAAYGTLAPTSFRCSAPGAVGCPGGLLGAAAPAANANDTMWFNLSMYDYGFWIVNTVDGANETGHWVVYEGFTIHVNVTSLPADSSVGGVAYHGVGIELNATGQQLMSVSAPVGKWVKGTFTAPTHAYYRQHLWCTVYCGNGHDGMQAFVLYIEPATALPSVHITSSSASGPAPLTVHLTGSVSGGKTPYATSWNFGDGSASSSNLTVNHTYLLAGNYSATLSVTDGGGAHASGSVAVSVRTASALTASIQASALAGVEPFGLTLTGVAGGGAPPYAYSWDLGDGAHATGPSLTHLYATTGVFGITLTITDAAGAQATATGSVTVHSAVGSFPVALSATPATGASPLGVAFSATGTGGTAPYTALWIFGDGTYGTGLTTTHSFANPGHYTATAYLTDAAGKVGENTSTVIVNGTSAAPPAAYLVEAPADGAPPLTVTAAASVWAGSGSYGAPVWQFGDGSPTAAGWTIRHTYVALGKYDLSVQVSDGRGAIAVANTTVLARGLSLAIQLNVSRCDTPCSVGAAATIQGGSGSYGTVTWNWGDGTTTTGDLANHTYAASVVGPLNVSASVSDSTGAPAQASTPLSVLPRPVATVLADPPIGHAVPFTAVFSLTVTGGSGSYLSLPLWSFGDGETTRGPSPQNHTYVRFGHYHVTVTTNDSFGVVAVGSAWVNLSIPGSNLGSATPVWSFTGVGDPTTGALVLLGLTAVSGLFLLHRKKGLFGRRGKPPSPTTSPRPIAPSDVGGS